MEIFAEETPLFTLLLMCRAASALAQFLRVSVQNAKPTNYTARFAIFGPDQINILILFQYDDDENKHKEKNKSKSDLKSETWRGL